MKNKIVTIRSTSGGGKSHLARSIMALFIDRAPQHIPGRKQPLWYRFSHPHNGQPLAVIGHYESACGGCDTITDVASIFELIPKLVAEGYDILYEGLMLAGDVTRIRGLSELPEAPEVHAIYLDTPIEVCLASINERRRARGKMEPVPEKNTRAKYRGVTLSRERLAKEAPKVTVHNLSRGAAFDKAKEIFSL